MGDTRHPTLSNGCSTLHPHPRVVRVTHLLTLGVWPCTLHLRDYHDDSLVANRRFSPWVTDVVDTHDATHMDVVVTHDATHMDAVVTHDATHTDAVVTHDATPWVSMSQSCHHGLSHLRILQHTVDCTLGGAYKYTLYATSPGSHVASLPSSPGWGTINIQWSATFPWVLGTPLPSGALPCDKTFSQLHVTTHPLGQASPPRRLPTPHGNSQTPGFLWLHPSHGACQNL